MSCHPMADGALLKFLLGDKSQVRRPGIISRYLVLHPQHMTTETVFLDHCLEFCGFLDRSWEVAEGNC